MLWSVTVLDHSGIMVYVYPRNVSEMALAQMYLEYLQGPQGRIR